MGEPLGAHGADDQIVGFRVGDGFGVEGEECGCGVRVTLLAARKHGRRQIRDMEGGSGVFVEKMLGE